MSFETYEKSSVEEFNQYATDNSLNITLKS